MRQSPIAVAGYTYDLPLPMFFRITGKLFSDFDKKKVLISYKKEISTSTLSTLLTNSYVISS
jgi:hypothetical protein